MSQVGIVATREEFALLAASVALQGSEIGSLISSCLRGALVNKPLTLYFWPQDIPHVAQAAREQRITIQVLRDKHAR